MNIFESRFNPMMWFMALVLAAVVAGTPAFAAPAPTFSATASGTVSNLTLTANITIGDADVGRNGNVYLAAYTGSAWYVHNGSSWVLWSGGSLPVYSVGLLANRSIEVLRNANLSALVGTQIYVGYGLDESDMLANGKYGLVYTVRTPTTISATCTSSNLTVSNYNAIAAGMTLEQVKQTLGCENSSITATGLGRTYAWTAPAELGALLPIKVIQVLFDNAGIAVIIDPVPGLLSNKFIYGTYQGVSYFNTNGNV